MVHDGGGVCTPASVSYLGCFVAYLSVTNRVCPAPPACASAVEKLKVEHIIVCGCVVSRPLHRACILLVWMAVWARSICARPVVVTRVCGVAWAAADLLTRHMDCGGVRAAMSRVDLGGIDAWLRNIRDVARLHKDELFAIEDEEERLCRLVELNVMEQCMNVMKVRCCRAAIPLFCCARLNGGRGCVCVKRGVLFGLCAHLGVHSCMLSRPTDRLRAAPAQGDRRHECFFPATRARAGVHPRHRHPEEPGH
jgi:hypothetical protein